MRMQGVRVRDSVMGLMAQQRWPRRRRKVAADWTAEGDRPREKGVCESYEGASAPPP